jgi:hypothetical protein
MVAPMWGGPEIGSRSDAGQITKIVNEVGLIGITMLGRNHAPVNAGCII